jgi:hypothetical protein
MAAKGLHPAIAAFRRLYITRRITAQQNEVLGFDGHRSAECGAGQALAIAAMTDTGAARIDFPFPSDRAAMTAAVHSHRASPTAY